MIKALQVGTWEFKNQFFLKKDDIGQREINGAKYSFIN